jgi:hypothetical protein
VDALLVGAAAEEQNLTVLRYDANFDLIATATGKRCRWVVLSGTLD